MSRGRLILLSLVFMLISCLMLTSWHNIRDEVMRWNLSRDLPEAREEFSQAVQQIPLEGDELISSEFSDFRILDSPPDCIRSRGVQIFASTNSYETTLSRFVEKFEDIEWDSRRHPEETPDSVINYMSSNKHMLISVLPLSEFDTFWVDYPDNLQEEGNIYTIIFRYHRPDAETCVF